MPISKRAAAAACCLALLTASAASAQSAPPNAPPDPAAGDPASAPVKTKMSTVEKAHAAIDMFGSAVAAFQTLRSAKKAGQPTPAPAQNGAAN